MVKIIVEHENTSYEVELEVDDGVEFLRFQLMSLTDLPPDQQAITGLGPGVLQDNTNLRSLNIQPHTRVVVTKTQPDQQPQQQPARPIDFQNCCSRTWLGQNLVTQPSMVHKGTKTLCFACASTVLCGS